MNEGTVKWADKKHYPYSWVTRFHVYFCSPFYLLYQLSNKLCRNMTTYDNDVNGCL